MRTFILRIGILFALASIVGGCQSQNLDMSSAKVEKKGPPIVVRPLRGGTWGNAGPLRKKNFVFNLSFDGGKIHLCFDGGGGGGEKKEF